MGRWLWRALGWQAVGLFWLVCCGGNEVGENTGTGGASGAAGAGAAAGAISAGGSSGTAGSSGASGASGAGAASGSAGAAAASGGGSSGASGSSGSGGIAEGGRGGEAGDGGIASDCGGVPCTSSQVCVAYRIVGGVPVLPDAGACPTGAHLESTLCQRDFNYQCVELSGCGASNINCTCGSVMCRTGYSACRNPTPAAALDPAAQLVCEALVP